MINSFVVGPPLKDKQLITKYFSYPKVKFELHHLIKESSEKLLGHMWFNQRD